MAVALLALQPAARVLPDSATNWALPGLCGAGLLLAAAALLTGGTTVAAGPLHWALDGLSGWMALPVLLLGAVGGPRGAVALGSVLLALVAADALSFGLALAGVVASTAWRPRAEVALLATFALYALARGLLDPHGPAIPGWVAVPVIAVALAGAGAAGLRLAVAPSLEAALHASALANAGLAAAGFGVAMAARGADLPPLAALALAGGLLLSLTGAAASALLRLCAEAVRMAVGNTALAGLGGVMLLMPMTGRAMLLALASLAGLPPLAGFAGLFLVLQAMLAGPRIGGLGVQIGFAAALVLAGLAAAALAAGSLRLAGLVLLGQPRSAAAVAARDPGWPLRVAMAGLAAVGLLLGLWPGAALVLMRPALRPLVGAELVDAPPYLPSILAVLLAAGGGAIAWAVRRTPAPATRQVPRWEGGLPAGVADGAAYAPGLLAALPARPALRLPSLRQCLGLLAAVLLLLLIVLAAR